MNELYIISPVVIADGSAVDWKRVLFTKMLVVVSAFETYAFPVTDRLVLPDAPEMVDVTENIFVVLREFEMYAFPVTVRLV
jgi:hypothetical protein